MVNTEYNVLNNNVIEILHSQQGILELNAIKRLNGNNNNFKRNYIGYNELYKSKENSGNESFKIINNSQIE